MASTNADATSFVVTNGLEVLDVEQRLALVVEDRHRQVHLGGRVRLDGLLQALRADEQALKVEVGGDRQGVAFDSESVTAQSTRNPSR